MGRARWIVGLLGVVAVLSVLGATLTVLVHDSSRAHRSAPEQQWLRAYGVAVAVPTERWRLTSAGEQVGYGDGLQVRSPAVLDEGFCASAASSSRAFVGLLPPLAGAVSAVLDQQLAAWASGVHGAPMPVAPLPRGATRADLDVPVPPGPCAPTAAHLTVAAQATPGGVVTLVLIRDVGEPDDLSAEAADAIVQSLRSRT